MHTEIISAFLTRSFANSGLISISFITSGIFYNNLIIFIKHGIILSAEDLQRTKGVYELNAYMKNNYF